MKRLRLFSLLLLLSTICCMQACKHHHRRRFDAKAMAAVKDSVNQMTINIARDISAKGPIAWLGYFDNSPEFFMANDGQLAFRNYQSAQTFIKDTLVKSISKITLKWSNTRVDILSPCTASIGSEFHEDITFANGKPMPFDGYFTGTAISRGKSWKLRNLHWSMKAAK
jgi:hypothetical protein